MFGTGPSISLVVFLSVQFLPAGFEESVPWSQRLCFLQWLSEERAAQG